MRLVVAAAALAAAVMATPALAADGPQINWYGDLGYSQVDGGGANLGAITGRLGGRNQEFGLEAEVASGISSQNDGGVNVKLNDEYALDAVIYAPASPNADLFVRAGYGHMDVKVSCCGVSATVGANAWNVGVGGQYFFTHNDGVRLDYTYYKMSNIGGTGINGSENAYTISYVRRF
ncbi:MAG TPA: outer membrane beta-barrel protein [Caulobacteraceae bacterium]|jgi:opacity protein-like surface antigen|nr:outer membrane beta-barrel protein [Caulobacteraceae bacterium]